MNILNLILSIFPIILLIYLMVKRNALPSYVALPLIAGLVYAIQLFYFKGDFTVLNANIISALLSLLFLVLFSLTECWKSPEQ